jgi:hypothetical protein
MTEWTSEEDEAFNEVEKHSNLGKQILKHIEGQPYHFDTYVSPSQRNHVLEEAAKLCEDHPTWTGRMCAQTIRGLKK